MSHGACKTLQQRSNRGQWRWLRLVSSGFSGGVITTRVKSTGWGETLCCGRGGLGWRTALPLDDGGALHYHWMTVAHCTRTTGGSGATRRLQLYRPPAKLGFKIPDTLGYTSLHLGYYGEEERVGGQQSKIRHKNFRSLSFACPSRSRYAPPLILEWGQLEESSSQTYLLK